MELHVDGVPVSWPDGLGNTPMAANVSHERSPLAGVPCVSEAAETVHGVAGNFDEAAGTGYGLASGNHFSQQAGSFDMGCVRNLADATRVEMTSAIDRETLQDLFDLQACGLPVVWPLGWDTVRARNALGRTTGLPASAVLRGFGGSRR